MEILLNNFFDLKIFIVEIFLLISGVSMLIFGVYICNMEKYKFPVLIKEFNYFTILISLISIFLVSNNFDGALVLESGFFMVDDLISFLKIFILLVVIGFSIASMNYTDKVSINFFEYNVLILFSIFGLLAFISSNNFIALYLTLEIQSLSFFILASIKRDSAFSTEGGLKYFILGAFSSGLLLLGFSFIYGFLGVTDFESISKFLLSFDNYVFLDKFVLGGFFILFALLFKLVVVPFHMWAPDVYEGAPYPVAMFFSVIPKIGVFFIFIKLLFVVFYDLIIFWNSLIFYCSLGSIFLGISLALYQKRIKKFLVYSSISHMGFMLIGFSTGTFEGLQSLFFYFFVYIIMSLNIWSFFLLIFKNKGNSLIRNITDLQGLVQSNKVLAFSFLVNLLSMAGIPPLAGFFIKFYIFFSSVNVSLYTLVFFALFFGAIGVFYYIRIIKLIFFDKRKSFDFYVDSSNSIAFIFLGFYFLISIFFFVFVNDCLFFIEYLLLAI